MMRGFHCFALDYGTWQLLTPDTQTILEVVGIHGILPLMSVI
jgi:hypothetical protein